MTPGARAQAAIELLDAIDEARGPADSCAQHYFRTRRFIGAKDRAAISRVVYGVLRRRAQIDWWLSRAGGAEPDARRRVFVALAVLEGWGAAQLIEAFDGGRFRPPALSAAERNLGTVLAGRSISHPDQPVDVRINAPAWLVPMLSARFGGALEDELDAVVDEATLDLRVNLLKGERDDVRRRLAAEGVEAGITPLSPWGLRLKGRARLGELKAFKDGSIEVQDEGSQVAAAMVDARPGMRVCDFCAGAGGKTLALAATMRNAGKIVACDTVARRLDGAAPRLRRAGVSNVERRLLATERDVWVKRHKESFDRVLVDAPCTGTGTWRRNPDARWFLAPADLRELVAKQARILDSAARLVRPGGRLVYVTCSLLPAEDEKQVDAFLARDPGFRRLAAEGVWHEAVSAATALPGRGPDLVLTPHRHGTDGFYVAVLERHASARPADEG
ncbi:MAG: RsmB/NOP family class I SAM-dependent RNA methyltransferase [Alphaproteobacteria bacterium]|nr:RsmB/NOP family class I SAM-dependent RNA methyltransferase [Alphaproteobacteria bacterium]